ncbi:MAG TPA: hypothetical protein VGG03_24035, partial [Thermoanaerobaculia bacterium]
MHSATLVLVYGDPQRTENPREKASRIRTGLERLESIGLPIERHAVLAELLVEAGELEQGLLDRELAAHGEERTGPVREAASRLTRAVAEALLASFQSAPVAAAPVWSTLDDLLALDLPAAVSVSVPEGFAFYGLYPEMYFKAAAELRGGLLSVIGIRSIGTALAAAVAAAVGEQASAISVRPGGHPF